MLCRYFIFSPTHGPKSSKNSEPNPAMIPLTKGFRPSVKKHNIEIDVLADWIEACALFHEDSRLSGSELVDFLKDSEIYRKQDFCWEAIDEGLREVHRRSKSSIPFALSV